MTHLTRCIRGFAATVLLIVSMAFARADNEPPIAPRDPMITLPDLKVTSHADLPPPESWLYGRIGGFEVLSNASDRATRRMLSDFAKFTQAMSLVWPAPSKPLPVSTLILCGRGGGFGAFPPADATKNDAIVPSVLLRNREQMTIVVDTDADRVNVNPATVEVTGPVSTEYEVNHYRLFYREYVRYLISQTEPRPPIWVEEGIAQIVMDADVDDKSLIYGKINSLRGGAAGGISDLLGELEGVDPSADIGAVVGEQPFNVVLQRKQLIPFDRFFALTADSPEARNPLGNNLWSKQAYAFVHFCLFGENLRYQQALSTFVSRLAREPLSESLFKECFKIGYKDMGKELRAYILYTKHKYQRYALQKDDQLSAKNIQLRDATTAEVGLIKGDALRLGGHFDAAFAAYRSAWLRGAREPALLAGMGMTEIALNHWDRAREFLEAAAQAHPPLPSTYVALARLRLDDSIAHPAANGKLSATQLNLVLTPLFEARKYQPPLPETYELIASTWAHSSVAPTIDHLAVLDEGIRAFPRNSALLYSAAQLYQQANAPTIAASIARAGIRFSADDAAKSRFEQLLASLPAAPAKP